MQKINGILTSQSSKELLFAAADKDLQIAHNQMLDMVTYQRGADQIRKWYKYAQGVDQSYTLIANISQQAAGKQSLTGAQVQQLQAVQTFITAALKPFKSSYVNYNTGYINPTAIAEASRAADDLAAKISAIQKGS